jgi:hypothetical protein
MIIFDIDLVLKVGQTRVTFIVTRVRPGSF